MKEKPDYCNCIDGVFNGDVDWISTKCGECEKELDVGEHVYSSLCGFTLKQYICEKCHDDRDDCEESDY